MTYGRADAGALFSLLDGRHGRIPTNFPTLPPPVALEAAEVATCSRRALGGFRSRVGRGRADHADRGGSRGGGGGGGGGGGRGEGGALHDAPKRIGGHRTPLEVCRDRGVNVVGGGGVGHFEKCKVFGL